MNHIRPSIVLIVLFTILTGLVLPLAFVAGAGALAPGLAGGSLLSNGDTVVGSALIGQTFTKDTYFQGRPSATTDTDPADSTKTVPAPYNANSSGGSNMAATSKALIDRVTPDVEKLGGGPVPGDSVTTSASGLDPDISPGFAARQVARVAKARSMPETQVAELVARHTKGRLFGIVGQPRVNVLELNMALDAP